MASLRRRSPARPLDSSEAAPEHRVVARPRDSPAEPVIDAPGVEAIEGFHGADRGTMLHVEWSHDGEMIATSAREGGAIVWRRGHPVAPHFVLGKKGDIVAGIAWHPTAANLAAVLIGAMANDPGLIVRWDALTGERTEVCPTGSGGTGVAWSPSGERLAVTEHSSAISLWDVATLSKVDGTSLGSEGHYRPRWSADGRTLVVGGKNGAVYVIDALDLDSQQMLTDGTTSGAVLNTALTPDGGLVASGHRDGTVHVWERATGIHRAMLEGHRGEVLSVEFSRRGDVLASAAADEIRLWRVADWECVGRLSGGAREYIGGLAFHPTQPILAAKNQARGAVDCWRVDFGVLVGQEVAHQSRRYVNAKVVLLGDTGVGKSGLGLVLSGQPYAATDSTHGRNVWVFEPPDGELSSGSESREVMLWDLAGQPGYRLVHQLHLNEVAVALVVFDSRSETDPFAGVKHWTRAVAHARRLEGSSALPMRTFLVAARADRGGVPVTSERVRALVDDLGLAGFFETSAKEGWQTAELKAALLEAIPWDRLPTISSNELLEEIRTFILEAKQDGRVLATGDDLFRDYCKRASSELDDDDLRAEFDACLGRVESRGLIRRLRFGGFVLLQPELLDAYASAIVQAAKEEPDGLGVVAEEDALEARFKLADAERISDRDQEKLLLIATVEELLRHEVALKEATDRGVDLVFPSQFTRERPDAPHMPGRELTLGLEGSLHNVYATLAVRLARSHLFTRREMWRNAATYSSLTGGVCGVYLRELEEGVGELDVFFDEHAGEAVRRQFETYVFEHVQQRAGAGSVSRRRVIKCTGCSYPLPDDLVRRKLERGTREMRCPDCEEVMVSLVADADHAARPDAAVTEMHLNADARRNRDIAATRLKGKAEAGDYDVFLCHTARDKAEVKAIGERLRERGIHPWLDEWSIPPGTRWQKELAKQLRSVRSAAVFIGSGPRGPWQDLEVERLLQRMARDRRPLIPVILENRKGKPRLPDFLTLWHLVDMRVPDPDPFEQLVWGITGEKPDPGF